MTALVARWLTISEAAERVDRSEGTIRRWIRQNLVDFHYGRIAEGHLLAVDKRMREQAKQPRATKRITLKVGTTLVGEVWVNTSSGKVVRGKIEPSDIVDSVDILGLG